MNYGISLQAGKSATAENSTIIGNTMVNTKGGITTSGNEPISGLTIIGNSIIRTTKSVLKDPAIADITGASGGAMGLSNSRIQIRLKPLAERKISAQEVVNRIRMNAPKVPGAIVFLSVDQDIRLSSPFGSSDSNRPSNR